MSQTPALVCVHSCWRHLHVCSWKFPERPETLAQFDQRNTHTTMAFTSTTSTQAPPDAPGVQEEVNPREGNKHVLVVVRGSYCQARRNFEGPNRNAHCHNMHDARIDCLYTQTETEQDARAAAGSHTLTGPSAEWVNKQRKTYCESNVICVIRTGCTVVAVNYLPPDTTPPNRRTPPARPIHEIRCYNPNMKILWKAEGGLTNPRQKYTGPRAAVNSTAGNPQQRTKQNRVTTHIAFVDTEQTRVAACGSCGVFIMHVDTGCTLAILYMDSGQPVHRICPTPLRPGNPVKGGSLFTLSYAGMVDFWTYEVDDIWSAVTPTDAAGHPIPHTPFTPNPAPLYDDSKYIDLRHHPDIAPLYDDSKYIDMRHPSHAYTPANFHHFDFKIHIEPNNLFHFRSERPTRFVSTPSMQIYDRPTTIPADLVSDLHGRSLIAVYDNGLLWRQLTHAGKLFWDQPEHLARRNDEVCTEKKVFTARDALYHGALSVVIFTESGERFVVGGRNYSSVVIFATDTCDVHQFIPLHTPAPHCICDLGQEPYPAVRERMTDACRHMGHNDVVKDVQISPDGMYLVTLCMKGTLVVWDATTGNMIRKCSQKNVRSFTFARVHGREDALALAMSLHLRLGHKSLLRDLDEEVIKLIWNTVEN